MATAYAFGDILEAANELSIDEQETLIDVLRRRIAEHRRMAIVRDVREAREELEAGHCRSATPDEILDEILS